MYIVTAYFLSASEVLIFSLNLLLGSSLPQDITTLRVSATSHELAIFTWFVPSISYTPETYILQYQSLGGEVSGPVMMTDPILGTTDLSATNQEYQVVVDNLLPGTTYTYYLVSTNVEGSVLTPPGRTFTTQNPSEYTNTNTIKHLQ